MKEFSCLVVLFAQCLSFRQSSAQITGPEQDCVNAIPVCQNVIVQNQSYIGLGNINDINPGNSCLSNDENNSVWYIFNIDVSGVLEFTITPLQTGDDYDFAVYNLTGASCADIFNGNIEVRCNYAFTNGPTGLKTGDTTFTQGPGGVAFLAPLSVMAGETYAIVIDNFSVSINGFTLDFSPSPNSTASILDSTPPVIDSIIPPACDVTSFCTVVFSEPIACSSLDSLGSNFFVSGPSTINVSGIGCPSGTFTKQVQLNFSTPVAVSGSYSLYFNPTMNGVVADGCGNVATSLDTLTVHMPSEITVNYAYDCNALDYHFTNASSGDSLTYTWIFGDGDSSILENPSHTFNSVGLYPVTLVGQNSECIVSETKNIRVLYSYTTSFSYSPNAIRAGQSAIFLTTSSLAGSGFYWDFSDGSFSTESNPIHVFTTPGTYLVCLTSLLGCYSDTACQSIIVLDSLNSSASSIENNFIDIFPNPVHERAIVRMHGLYNVNANVRLYNILGGIVLAQQVRANQFEINFSPLPSGIYYLKIEMESAQLLKEIIKL